MNKLMFNSNKDSVEVSVIIPCYNGEKNIKKTLESLENQSYKNFELIIINDGSTDNSNNIIKEYLYNSKMKATYIVQENNGVSKSRNRGIHISKGKYIMFLDADDIYRKDCIEVLLNSIERTKSDTVYGCYSRDIKKLNEFENLNSKQVKLTYLNHENLLMNFMYRRGPCIFCNFIYKKQILDENNIYFTENVKYGEDLEFVWKYLSNCNNGYFIDEQLYGYYDNPASAMNNVRWENVQVLDSMKRVDMYLKDNNDEFQNTFSEYMHHRAIWALMKDFARSNRNDLFNKLIEQENVKLSMQKMSKNGTNILIRLSSTMYCISPRLFYNVIKLL